MELARSALGRCRQHLHVTAHSHKGTATLQGPFGIILVGRQEASRLQNSMALKEPPAFPVATMRLKAFSMVLFTSGCCGWPMKPQFSWPGGPRPAPSGP